MIGIALAAQLGLSAAACQGGLCGARALEPWFAKVERAQRSGPPLHVLQIGDSHTAGDAITGAWRNLLQARLGSGGRGVMPPGRPYNGFLSYGATASMTGAWTVSASFGAGSASPRPPLGLSGFTLSTATAGATIGLVADSNEQFDRAVVCAVTQPGGGLLSIRVGGVTTPMDLDSNTRRPECRTLRSGSPAEELAVTVERGPATITSIGTFRDAGGVALSNLGVVGSQLVHFARTDDEVLAQELRAYDPDLIVLAFGTNEGFSPRFTPFEYEVTLRTQIGRLRRLAGNVPILLLGAPDAASRRAEMRANALGYSTEDCAGTAPPPPAAAPVTQAAPAQPPIYNPLAQIMAAIRGEPAPAPAPVPSSAPGAGNTARLPPGAVVQPLPAPSAAERPAGLFAPAALQAVRDVQRRVAASLGAAYWDWNARMGGRCTAVSWARQNPALMRSDYVHYTSLGGREIATRLQADLDRAAAQR